MLQLCPTAAAELVLRLPETAYLCYRTSQMQPAQTAYRSLWQKFLFTTYILGPDHGFFFPSAHLVTFQKRSDPWQLTEVLL